MKTPRIRYRANWAVAYPGQSTLVPLALALFVGIMHPCKVWSDLADGTLRGVVTLLDSGDPAGKIDIVFLGDGFTDSQQGSFNSKVDAGVSHFLASHPFKALHCAFNIHRVNVASRESGTDVPANCGRNDDGTPKASPETARSRATAMNTTYCFGGEIFRCVGSTDAALVQHWAMMAPGADFLVVLVNDSGYGGCRVGNLTCTTLHKNFEETIVHELGHALSDLADEYDDDDPGSTSYTGGEPRRANITIARTKEALKWNDLVLGNTSIPTSTVAAPASKPSDLVGTYEGGNQRFKRDIFRPQPKCLMRDSQDPFCSVCRRKLIQDIAPGLCRPWAVDFFELLVKDASEAWGRGSGEIYFNFSVSSHTETISGRWPGSSGESDFDDGESKILNNFFAGIIPEPRPGETASINIQMRESDWPDSDDSLRHDAAFNFNSPGLFQIDQPDYRLAWAVRPADLKVLLDTMHIKDDPDPWPAGEGEIYVRYTVSNGAETIHGRWPSSGTAGIGGGGAKEMGVLAAALAQPSGGNVLTLRIEVWDEDGWFTDGDDKIGDHTFTLSSSTRFGAEGIVHVRDESGYRITFSIVECP